MSSSGAPWLKYAPAPANAPWLKYAPQTALSQGPDNKTNVLDDALHDATGGLIDKLDAAAEAVGVPGLPAGVPGETFSDRYHKNLTNIRNKYQDYEAANPGWMGAKGAKAVGVIAPMLVAGPEKAAQTVLQASLKGAGTGAAVGAGFGLGSTDDTSLAQDAKAAGLGALGGAAAGGALPAASSLAAAPARAAGRAVTAFGTDRAEQLAGHVLNETTGNIPLTFEKPPIPGMTPTLGQATNDPGALWLENSLNGSSPKAAALAKATQTNNNQAIRSAVGTLGDANSNSSQAMSDALDAAYARRKAANSAIWKQADVSNTGGVSGFQFNNFVKGYVSKLPIPDQAMVPTDVMGVMDKMAAAKTQNLSDVQAVRSMLTSKATMAARAGDGNTARVLGGMADQVENFIDMKAANLGDKFPLYNQARADTRDLKQTFNQPPAVRAALGVDSFGADKVPVSATADHFIKTGKGAHETFNSYLNAISTKDPATGKISYDPAGMKAAQDAFSDKFLRTISQGGMDQNGNPLVSPAKTAKFLSDYSHVINSPLFAPAQRDLITSVGRAAQMTGRVANGKPPGGGSDSYQKLAGDKFINVLIGPGATKILNGVGSVGGTVAGYLHGGLADAAIGMLGGEKGASYFNKLYQAPRDRVMDLVTQAMNDPDLAKALMTKASSSNFKLIKPSVRAKMLGVLGAETVAPAPQ